VGIITLGFLICQGRGQRADIRGQKTNDGGQRAKGAPGLRSASLEAKGKGKEGRGRRAA